MIILIFMDFSEFVSNLQNEILLKTVPGVVIKTGAAVIASGGFSHIESYKEEITHFTVESATNVVSRNVVEYVLINTAQKPTSFGKKLAIRFSSRSLGALFSRLAFSKDKNFTTIILQPLCAGFISSAGYMTVHHDESSRFLRAYFPSFHQALVSMSETLGIDKPMNWIFAKIDGK